MSGDVSPLPRWRRLHALCLAGVVVGTLMQLTLRDWAPFPVSLFFYALPRPLICLLAILGAITAANARRSRQMFLVAVVIAGWVAWSDVAWNSISPPSGAAHRVVFWNVGHDLEDDVAVVGEFLTERPLLIGLVESGPLSADWLTDWGTRHPDYEFALPHQGLFLAVRGRILNQGHEALSNNGHIGWVETEYNGQAVLFLVVDISANPWISRREPLEELAAWLAERDHGPVIVMGDFNTPVESVWFAKLSATFREAFHVAGAGYIPTWPWPVPVLKLDQIWINRSVRVERAWQQATWRSDHRAQWADIAWESTPAGFDDSPRKVQTQ